MINMAKTADGRAFPRYSINLGVLVSDLNIRKGKNLVNIVPSDTIAIVIILCTNVITFSSKLIYTIFFSILPLKAVSTSKIPIIDKIINLSLPNISLQITVITIPTNAEV